MSYVSVTASSSVCVCTWLVPAEPLVKDCVSEGVQQDEDGIVGREMSLSARPIEEEVSQVVEAANHWVVCPLRGAVA